MPFQRPSGSACFELVNQVSKWVETCEESTGHTPPAPFGLVMEKPDGFHVVVAITSDGKVGLSTKNGNPYDPKINNRLGSIGKIMFDKFTEQLEASRLIFHPQAGKVTHVYGEVTCDTGNGDNLQALMHGKLNELALSAIWRLRVFDCDFRNTAIKVSLADKLDLCRLTLGPEYVVRVLIDAREPVTYSHLEALDKHMATAEGVVAVRGWKIKHKTSLPVPLWLVAVGFTRYGKAVVPTHFAWAVRTAKNSYTVVLIDYKGHLCNPLRKNEGKVCIKATEFTCKNEDVKGVIGCTNQTPAGKSYNQLLHFAGMLKKPTNCSSYMMSDDKNEILVGKDRIMNFTSALFRMLCEIRMGVVGCNQMWVGKSGQLDSIHLQGPQFLANPKTATAEAYGHPVHQMLFSRCPEFLDFPETPTLTPETLIRLASMPRNAYNHALIVYGCESSEVKYNVDLVYGMIVEKPDSPYSTPVHSDDDDDDAYNERRREDSARPNKQRKAMGLPCMEGGGGS